MPEVEEKEPDMNGQGLEEEEFGEKSMVTYSDKNPKITVQRCLNLNFMLC